MLKTIYLKSDNRFFTLEGDADIVTSFRKNFYSRIDFKEATETFYTSVFTLTSEWFDAAEELAREMGLLPVADPV